MRAKEMPFAVLFSYIMLTIAIIGVVVFFVLLLMPDSIIDKFSALIGLAGAIISFFVIFCRGIYGEQKERVRGGG